MCTWWGPELRTKIGRGFDSVDKNGDRLSTCETVVPTALETQSAREGWKLATNEYQKNVNFKFPGVGGGGGGGGEERESQYPPPLSA